MEFISKIGQIIVKARTVSPPISFDPAHSTTARSAGPTTLDPTRSSNNSALDGGSNNNNNNNNNNSGSNNGGSHHAAMVQQQNLEMVLQDVDLWRNSTPVHVNIFHAAQHALLERWVISYTPASVSVALTGEPARNAKSPYTGYLSPKARHLQSASLRSPSLSASGSTLASAPPKDTTDLVLLLQSLYTQIRSLPLQNCLTSFDERTKLAKADLAYSATSAQEEITLSRNDRSQYSHSQQDVGDAPIQDPAEAKYDGFTCSLKSALPLEFVQAASLKVLNFEASHVQWGCVRVTGMYDESVGGRIAPEHFQDSIKVQKKRHHKSKPSGSHSDLINKATKRHSRELSSRAGSWTSVSQPIRQDTSLEQADGFGMVQSTLSSASSASALEPDSRHLNKDAPQPSSLLSISQHQQGAVSVSSSENIFGARLQSLKQNSDRLISSLTSSARLLGTASDGVDQTFSYKTVLQDSPLPKHDAGAVSASQSQEQRNELRSRPQLSPLTIPHSWKADSGDVSASPYTGDSSEKTPTRAVHSPSPFQQLSPASLQYSPPGVQPALQHQHSPFSTSPLARVITRRRSSRLSIVTTCNDDSPVHTRSHSPSLMMTPLDMDNPLDDDSENTTPNRPLSPFHRRSSLQDQKTSESLEAQSKPFSAHSPTRPAFLRRSSLNPSSFTHGDLFGSLVGSYEESILSGRMSTLPSRPLMFTAQIGVLASHDYKDCPPKLRCPKHVQLEFPAVFYDYESSPAHHTSHASHASHASHPHSHGHPPLHPCPHAHPQSSSHPYHHQSHSIHHSSLAHPLQSKSGHWNSPHPPVSPSYPIHGPLSSSPGPASFLSSGLTMTSSHGSGAGSISHNLTHAIPTAQNDPILPYVGNLDLDSCFRGSRRFSKMPGGMRIPLRGQVQVMIKNPNKTVVKVFLVPYDLSDMPAGTKTFLRQKYYSTGTGIFTASGLGTVAQNVANGGNVGGINSSSNSSNNNNSNNNNNSGSGGTLRYAIHLQFCCPAPGYIYLYRGIRVVFANRVPDGKESLRVVLEGLGMGSKTIGNNGTPVLSTPSSALSTRTDAMPKNLEGRYAKMRKGEVPFSGSKRKKDVVPTVGLSMDVDGLRSHEMRGFGLGLDGVHPHSTHPHVPFNATPPTAVATSFHTQNPRSVVVSHQPSSLDFDGQSLRGMDASRATTAAEGSAMGLEMLKSKNLATDRSQSGLFLTSTISRHQGSSGGIDIDGETDEYRSIPSLSTRSPILTRKMSGGSLSSSYLSKESTLTGIGAMMGRR